MIRRLLLPLLGSALLLAASAGSALGKCEGNDQAEFCSEVIVDLSVGGGIFHAGTQESVVINLSMGERPFEALGVVLSFNSTRAGTAVREPATATGQPGTWQADVLLPAGGSWDVFAQVVTADGSAYRIPLETIQVARAPDLPPATTPVAPPVTPTPVLPNALLVAGIAAAALSGLAIRDRSRRRTAGATAPSGASAASVDRA